MNTEGLTADHLAVHVDPLAELGSMLHAVTHGDHHHRARGLRERLHADRNDELFALANHYRPLYGGIRARFLLPMSLRRPEWRDLPSRIASLSELDGEAVARHSAHALLEFTRDAKVEGITTDRALRRELLRRVERLSISRLDLAIEVLEHPERTLAAFQEFLRAVGDEWFAPEWEALQPRLKAEVRLREGRSRALGAAVITECTPTAVESQDRTRIVFEKINRASVRAMPNGIVLVPSHYVSPHVIIKHDPGLPVVLMYELEPSAQEGRDLTQRRLAALNDHARAEICRAVLRAPRTTVDLAMKMQMTQPQMSRHLRALREAGLVVVERRGRFVYYSLDSRAVSTLGQQYLTMLHR